MNTMLNTMRTSLLILFACGMAGAAAYATPATPPPPAVQSRATPTLEAQPCLSETAARDCQQGVVRQSSEENSGQDKPANPAEYDAAAAPVPEPQTLLMMLIGLVLLGFTSKRRASEKFSD